MLLDSMAILVPQCKYFFSVFATIWVNKSAKVSFFLILYCSTLCGQCKAAYAPCNSIQELINNNTMGTFDLTKAAEEADVVGLATEIKASQTFDFYQKTNFKHALVPTNEFVIDGITIRKNTHNLVLFLTKINDSFQLYNQDGQDLQPMYLDGRDIFNKFMACLHYLLLGEQVPKIEVSGYSQKDWECPDNFYYFEENKNVNLTCAGLNTKLEETSKWDGPGLEKRDGSKIQVKKTGNYTCHFTIEDKESPTANVTLKALGEKDTLLKLHHDNKTLELAGEGDDRPPMDWIIDFVAHPNNVSFTWKHEGELLNFNCSYPTIEKDRYNAICDYAEGKLKLSIKNPSVHDAGTHSLKASIWKNGQLLDNQTLLKKVVVYDTSLEVVLSLETKESENLPKDGIHILKRGEKFSLECKAIGHPVTDIILQFTECASAESCSLTSSANEKVVADRSSNLSLTVGPKFRVWQSSAEMQGKYQCIANAPDVEFPSNLVTLGISDYEELTPMALVAAIKMVEDESVTKSSLGNITVFPGDEVTLWCRKNKMANLSESPIFNISLGDINITQENITNEEKEFINGQVWKLGPDLHKYNNSKISCGSSKEKQIGIFVKDPITPEFEAGRPNFKKVVEQMKNAGTWYFKTWIDLSCKATGLPDPKYKWTKDGKPFENDKPTLRLQLDKNGYGNYKCSASNRVGEVTDSVDLIWREKQPIALIVTICFCFVVIILGSVFSVVRAKRRKYALLLEEIAQLRNGAPELLNPELGLNQQAHLLPFDNQFEIASRRIEFGKLIGEGEFGNVFQAKVDNLLPHERQTTVAVKMAKSRSSEMIRKDLLAEVKIMMHIGRHANVINLLGICSENLETKGELLVLVEFCRHGNLRDYLIRHRKDFIPSMNMNDLCNEPDMKDESTVYAEMYKDEALSSTSSTPMVPTINALKQNHLQPLTVGNLNASSSSSEHAASVYSDMVPQKENLSQSDLLSWSYQIGKGMEYLSMRKVVHGDLAARNILLDERHTVKISDFGFAKDVYHENYKKSSQNGLMPVKWMSPEYLKDQIRSIQSDIWAYGILLWEIFSLGESPYQGIAMDSTFLEKIEKGYRLPCPKYSPENVYKIMCDCWEINPMSRPPFSDLAKKLLRLLSSRERQYFEQINKPYDEQIMSSFLESVITPNYLNLTSSQKNDNTAGISLHPPAVKYTPASLGRQSPTGNKTLCTTLSVSSLNTALYDEEAGGSDDGYLCMSNTAPKEKAPSPDQWSQNSSQDGIRSLMNNK